MPRGEIEDMAKPPQFKQPATLEEVKRDIAVHDLAMSERILMLEDHLKEVIRSEFDQHQTHMDKKIAAIHRNIHSKDKVSRILQKLMSSLEAHSDHSIWSCQKCGACVSVPITAGIPTCEEDGERMTFFGPAYTLEDSFKEALMYCAAIDTAQSDT